MGMSSRELLVRCILIFRPRRIMGVQPPDGSDTRLRELQSEGITHFPSILSATQALDLRNYFSAKMVCDTYRAEHGSFLPDSAQRHPDSHTAHHNARDVVMAPYLYALANDPRLIDLAGRFLECNPTLGYIAAWWSYATALGAQHAEFFHRDVDDLRFLKFFIYLTDVTPRDGPHFYVTKSAQSSKLRRIDRFRDSEVSAQFEAGTVLQLTGKAGDGFVENTFGLHKGQPVVAGPRLIFQAVYSMSPLPYGPLQPVVELSELAAVHAVKLDPWTNRLYVRA